jgi:predicted Zn-dependent peptidase
LQDVPVRRATTAAGLRVVCAAQPWLHRAHVAAYVRIGSRFEDERTNGLSHFLEHMLYRGTERLPTAHEVNLAFERIGGYLYAATHADYGVASVTLPPDSLDEAAGLFADVLLRPVFRDLEIEKGIVCEEILEDLDDEGRQVDADNLSRALMYGAHPLGFSIVGDERRVRSFDEAMLREHHLRHYTTSNMVLLFCGRVTPEQAFSLAERAFADAPQGARVPAIAPPFGQRKARLRVVENASSQTDLRLCFRAVPETSELQPALDVLMRVIDDGMSTRLYHRICDAQGLCYDVSASYEGYEDDGVVDFAAGVQHARTPRVAAEILELARELAVDGPTEEELDKVRRRLEWELSAVLDGVEELSHAVGTDALFGKERTLAERLTVTRAVAREQVIEVARMVFRPERLSAVAVGLLEKAEHERFADVVRGWRGAPG